MPECSRRRLCLLLALTPGVGGLTVSRVATRLDLLGMGADEFLKLAPEALRESFGLTQRQAQAVHSASGNWLSKADALEEKLSLRGVGYLTVVDAHFPAKLEQFDAEPPAAMFHYGNTRLLDSNTFSVLSSRNTTLRGLEVIEKRAELGVFNSETLVTGHDRPEYQRSAVVPLRWGSPRILVFDRGIYQALGEDLSNEPFRAARLWRYQFDPKTDLALSPFKPDSGSIGANNRIRDTLIAGLSDRIDFVEVAAGGNMEKLARAAIRSSRRVAVSDRSEIVHQLKAAGADVFDES